MNRKIVFMGIGAVSVFGLVILAIVAAVFFLYGTGTSEPTRQAADKARPSDAERATREKDTPDLSGTWAGELTDSESGQLVNVEVMLTDEPDQNADRDDYSVEGTVDFPDGERAPWNSGATIPASINEAGRVSLSSQDMDQERGRRYSFSLKGRLEGDKIVGEDGELEHTGDVVWTYEGPFELRRR